MSIEIGYIYKLIKYRFYYLVLLSPSVKRPLVVGRDLNYKPNQRGEIESL